jgi:hypothetical protein
LRTPAYRKVYASKGVIAYAPDGAFSDHLFLCAAANPAGEPVTLTLDALVSRWAESTDDVAVRQRALFFCQRFDLASIGAVLDGLNIPQRWGHAVYWGDPVFRGGPARESFPDGSTSPITLGQLVLSLIDEPYRTLDDFTIGLDQQQSALVLGLRPGAICRIRRGDGNIGQSKEAALRLPLRAANGFVAGALTVSLDWPSDRERDHPLRSAGFLFAAAPEEMPLPGEVGECRTAQAELADQVIYSPGDACVVALDPRDSPDLPPWLFGGMNSRLEPGQAVLRSSFFGTKGQRVHLKASNNGAARLGFVFNRILHDGNVETIGEFIFHPEGRFEIVSPHVNPLTTDEAQAGIGALDLVAGSMATEFFDVAGPATVTHIQFSPGGPAFLDDAELLVDKRASGEPTGRVITSFVRFEDQRGNVVRVDFHSQPSRSALFEAAVTAPDHLSRQRRALGSTEDALPIFPWAGHRNVDMNATTASLTPDFEVTHLSKYRRRKVATVTGDQAAQVSGDLSTLGVTPQGVLANLTAQGYSKLLFGNSDSANPAHAEFSLTINGAGSPIFREVQQALAASQLFFVFDGPSADALRTIEPDLAMVIRDFRFKIELVAQGPRDADAADRTILLVKYFNGKSVAELIDDPSLWALRNHLAKEATPEGIKRRAQLDGKIPEPLLTDVWLNPNWQGVLALHLPVDRMPPILEALEPGVVGSLVVHHFGLTAPPIRREDLTSGLARLGSAFGLLHYAKPLTDPDRPATIDVEPGAADRGKRLYRLVVNSLDVGFHNGQVSNFEAKVRVEFDHLFWDGATVQSATPPEADGAGPDALTLVGSYERRVKSDNSTEDVFSLRADHEFTVTFDSNSRLERFTIRRAQMSVVSRVGKTITAFIGIDGDLQLSERNNRIPLFKLKAIHLKDLGFEFVYRREPKLFTFGFKADGVAADLEFDPPAGSSSLMELMPVKLKGMAVAVGKLFDLQDLGFQPISFDNIESAFHFGFVLELDLGFLGRLAGETRGLRVPMLLGWRGGTQKGVALGIQFPTFNGKIDIGIQQFIRLRAAQLNLVPCPAPGPNLQALAIQAVDAKVVMFGREWPDAATSFAFFVPVHASRRASWALGVKPASNPVKYVGGGQRIALPGGSGVTGTKSIVDQFEQHLGDASQVCGLIGRAAPDADGWSLVARFEAGIKAWLAIDDLRQTYGLVLEIPVLGEIDVLYRRITDELGIFSAEYTLPEVLRTIQIGVAAVRLPTFRVEVHTDGGVLFDFGFPWRNDFSRSCQIEVAIFLGSGGFYYGRTSAAATDLLNFDSGYGFTRPDASQLARFRALRFGFALRIGIGRSFSIGILSAEASLTIFGGLEGAAAYPDGGGSMLAPALYALRGFVGLMLDIRAEVNFAIIKARARIVAYVMVGLELRRVLAKRNGTHHLVKLPTVLFAEVGLTVEVEVRISIGCVSITIRLSFSAKWRLEETLGSLESIPLSDIDNEVFPAGVALLPARPDWNINYRFWSTKRDLNLFVTVLPCMGQATDVGLPGDVRTCVVGQMLLPVLPQANGFGDFAKFLTGWLIRPETTTGIPDTDRITLETINGLRRAIKNGGEQFWDGFQAALLKVVAEQFTPIFNKLAPQHKDDPFAALTLWPGTAFSVRSTDSNAVQQMTPTFVYEHREVVRGDEVGFANYSSCVILAMLADIEQLINDEGQSPDRPTSPRNDPNKSLTWGAIWTRLFAA